LEAIARGDGVEADAERGVRRRERGEEAEAAGEAEGEDAGGDADWSNDDADADGNDGTLNRSCSNPGAEVTSIPLIGICISLRVRCLVVFVATAPRAACKRSLAADNVGLDTGMPCLEDAARGSAADEAKGLGGRARDGEADVSGGEWRTAFESLDGVAGRLESNTSSAPPTPRWS